MNNLTQLTKFYEKDVRNHPNNYLCLPINRKKCTFGVAGQYGRRARQIQLGEAVKKRIGIKLKTYIPPLKKEMPILYFLFYWKSGYEVKKKALIITIPKIFKYRSKYYPVPIPGLCNKRTVFRKNSGVPSWPCGLRRHRYLEWP